MRKRAFVVTVFTIAVFSCTYIAIAQVPVHHVEDQCGKIYADPVSTYPPLSATMPANVAYGYTLMDSLCRIGTESMIDSLLNVISSDTLSLLMKSYYDIIDYDPILFMEYARTSSDYEEYSIGIGKILNKVLDAYHQVHEYKGHEKLFTWAEYIYRVRVISQSSTLDSSMRLHIRYYCASVEVLDKIKGAVLPDPSREIYSGRKSVEGFMKIWWGQVEGGQVGAMIWDSVRYVAVREGYLVPGNEYVVFIDATPQFISDTDIGYLLKFSDALTKVNSFAYPVEHGNVIDAEGYFGTDEKIPYNDFVEWIKSARDAM